MSNPASKSAPLILVVSGPGGVGKGTIVKALVEYDRQLWLSRSWTTRTQRAGEADDAYVFTSRDAFEERLAAGGFLEWTEFLGNYYGTPNPESTDGRDVVLEIEVDGAQQVKLLDPNTVLIFVLPPSRAEQERRLRGRGDPDQKVEERLRKAEDEEPIGMQLADYVVVNDDLDTTINDMLHIVDECRRKAAG